MAIKIHRCSYKDSNYSEEGSKTKQFKHIQNHTIEFQQPSPFILVFGIWNLKVLHLLLLRCCYCLQQNNSDSVC